MECKVSDNIPNKPYNMPTLPYIIIFHAKCRQKTNRINLNINQATKHCPCYIF